MQNTIDILNSINSTVKLIAKHMAPQNGSGAAAINKLSKGNITTKSDVNPAADIAKPSISKASIGEVISVLNTISPTIISISKLSGSHIKKFNKVLDSIIESVNKLSNVAKKNKGDINDVKKIAESFVIFGDSIGKCTALVVKAPIATLGLKFANVTIKELGKILTTASEIPDVGKKIKKLSGITKAIDPIVSVVNKAALLVGVCMGLGLLLMVGPTASLIIGGLVTLGVVLLTATAIIALIGYANKAIEKTKAFNGVRNIMLLTLASVLLVAACFGLGLAIKAMGGWEEILYGLGTLLVVLLTLGAIFWFMGTVGQVAASPATMQAIKNIFLLTFGSMLIIVAAKYLGDYAIENYGSILIGIGCVAAIIVGLIGLGALAAKVLKGSRSALLSLAIIELVAIGAMGVMWAARQISDIIQGHEVEVLSTIGSAMLIIIGFGLLAALAGKLEKVIRKGIPVLGLVEAIAAGAIAVAGLVVGLDYIKTQNNISWGDIYLDVLGVMGIITAFGLLAVAASFIAGKILVGIIALAPLELLIAGAIGITHLLIDLHNIKDEYDIGWMDLEKDILGIASVVGTFGLLAAALGVIAAPVLIGTAALALVELLMVGAIGISHLLIDLHKAISDAGLTFDSLESDVMGMSTIMGTFGILASAMALLVVPIALGTPGMIAVAGFSLLVIGVIRSLVDVSKAIDEAGGHDKISQTLSVGIPAILKNINDDNFSVDIGYSTILKMMAKYALIADLISSILTVAESISKITQIVGIVDESGRIRQILSIDKDTNEVTYGEPVDLVNLATVISQTVKAFVENCQYSFADVKNMYRSKEIFSILSTITEPISKFVEMLTGFTLGEEQDTLAPVRIDEKGEVKIGHPVKVKDVANIIAGAVSSFVSELYNKENTSKWSYLIYGDRTYIEQMLGQTNKRADSVREVAGVLGVIIEPICKFVDMISTLAPGTDGTLRRIYVDKDGNIKQGPDINVITTGNIIAKLISSFITAIYKQSNEWKNVDLKSSVSLEKLLKPLNEMVKSAVEMSNEKIKPNVIIANADAIAESNKRMTLSLSNINPEDLNGKLTVMNTILKLAGGVSKLNAKTIQANSKAIVTFMTDVADKKMPKSKPKIDAFATSISTLKKAFKDLDTILIKDESKRNKALDDFEKRIKEIINTFKDGKSAMDSYNSVLTNTQDYRSPVNNTPTPFTISPFRQDQQNTDNQTGNNNNGLSADTEKIAAAIKSALNGLMITSDNPGGIEAIQIGDKLQITTNFRIEGIKQ